MSALGRKLVGFALMASLAFAAAGCKRISRVAECRKLADHVNAALDQISQAQDAGGADPATYRGLADRYTKLSAEVAAFSKTEDAFGRSVREYSGFLQETANQLRLLADASQRNDFVTVIKVRRELGNFIRRDKTAVAHIDTACATP